MMNLGGKSTLSDSERDRLKIPERYKLRTRGLGISQKQGVKLEETYYELISKTFPKSHTLYRKNKNLKQHQAEQFFLSMCHKGLQKNSFALEVSFNTEPFMGDFYKLLGVSNSDSHILPHLGYMRPDVLLISDINTIGCDEAPVYEVLPNGDIALLSRSDARICIFTCDIKLTEEASVGQFAEVSLYAWMLSNWIEHHNLQSQYAVVDTVGIWTNQMYIDYKGRSDLVVEGNSHEEKVKNWISSVSIRTFDQYMSSIKQVLIESVPRVLKQLENWQNLEYHLSPSCELCDFLGRMDQKKDGYINQDTKKIEILNYENLCAHVAFKQKHLSIVPGVTKGARRALESKGINSAKELINCDNKVFETHTTLKNQAHRIPEKTRAILKRDHPDFFKSKNISLARFPNLGIKFHINYDISNGLAASFSVQGAFMGMYNRDTPENERPKIKFFEQQTFLVENMLQIEEEKQLKGFLSAIENMFDFAVSPENNHKDLFNMDLMSGRPTVQFYCWDHYQLDFMKKVLTRHLGVLLKGDFSRALLWLFSPDELIDDPAFYRSRGRGGKLLAPYICVIKDIIQENGRWPVETAYPLFVVASKLDEKFKVSYDKTSWLHKAQLGDYIPRERILEIWAKSVSPNDVYIQALNDYKNLNTSNVDPLLLEELRKVSLEELSYKKAKELGEALVTNLPELEQKQLRKIVYEKYVDRYKKSARNQTWALASCRKFIAINKNVENLASPPPIMLDTMLDRQQVFTHASIKTLPADSQIWIIFAILDDQFALFDYNNEMASSISSLESKYSCIVVKRALTNLELANSNRRSRGTGHFYWISEDSKNCKIREGDKYLTLLLQNSPGFPFMRPYDLLREANNKPLLKAYEASFNKHELNQRFMELIKAEVYGFDRLNGIVDLSVNLSKPVVQQLIVDGLLVIDNNIAIARPTPLKRNHVMLRCLKEIGHPQVAYADPNSRNILLKVRPEKVNKKQAVTRAAEILWKADELNSERRKVPSSSLEKCIEFVSKSTGRKTPNDSQKTAIYDSLSRSLNLIWGPPGTGKTDTAIFILGTEIKLAIDAKCKKRLLITGPTKRAVIEILKRLFGVLKSIDQAKLNLICLQGSGSSDYDFILSEEWKEIENKAIGYGVNRVVGKGNLDNQLSKIVDIRQSLVSNTSSAEIIVVATHHHSISPLLTGASINKTDPNTPFPSIAELFDFTLVDESSQIDVADSLPILNALDINGRIVFAGDHLQMQPIQQAKIPKNSKHLTGSIQEYLIHRFNIVPSRLLTNYRSNEAIVEFGKRLGYPMALHAHNQNQRLECATQKQRPLPGFYPNNLSDEIKEQLFEPENSVVTLRYTDGISGQANPFEAMLTVNVILHYYQLAKDVVDFESEFWKYMVGVVTPHKAQRALIVKELCQIFPAELHLLIDQAVDTVERFQGGERNLIIISFGVGDEDIIRQEEDFLLNLNRTNVSISRAKQQAVLMLSEELLQHLTADEEVAEQAKALKRFDHYCKEEKAISMDWEGRKIKVKYRWR